jgi:hypothetical protein
MGLGEPITHGTGITQPCQYLPVCFHTEHHFDGSNEAVKALMVDADFYLDLALPDLSLPEVLERSENGDVTMLRLRYNYVGKLDPLAQRLLGSSRLAWIQETRVDRSAGSGAVHFEAEKDPRRLYGSTDFVLTSAGDGTVRHLDGELIVAVPGIGRMAERRIVPGLLRRLDIEAQGIEDQLHSENE